MPVQTSSSGRGDFQAPTAAALGLLKRTSFAAAATPNVVQRQASVSQSPEPTAVDCSLVTAAATSWTATEVGRPVEESVTRTYTVDGGPGCECANGVISG